MSNVIPFGSGVMPASPALPPPSSTLGWYAHLVLGGRFSDPIPLPVIEEAKRLLPAYEAACAPVLEQWVDLWLTELAAQVAGSETDDTKIAERLKGVMRASGDLPASSFSGDTLATAMRKFTWWPGTAEIDAIVRPASADLRRTRNALRMVAQQKPAAPRDDAPRSPAAEQARDGVLSAFKPSRSAIRPHAPVRSVAEQLEILARSTPAPAPRPAALPGPTDDQ